MSFFFSPLKVGCVGRIGLHITFQAWRSLFLQTGEPGKVKLNNCNETNNFLPYTLLQLFSATTGEMVKTGSPATTSALQK